MEVLCLYIKRMFFPRQFHLMCSILLLYLLIVLHNCKKTHISNFMITLLQPESTNTISLPLGKTRVLLKITQSLMFLLGGFHCKFSGLKRYIYLPCKYVAVSHFYCFCFDLFCFLRACLLVFIEKQSS